jgi:predicted transcriptional regulator
VPLRPTGTNGEFVAGVREGFAQLDRGEGRPIEDVAKELPSWISK